MMEPVYTSEGARLRDAYAIEELGIPSEVLMEHAAMGVVRSIPAGKVCVVCGPGNNGADGLAVARLLSVVGRDVSVVLANERVAGLQLEIVKRLGLPVAVYGTEKADTFLSSCEVVVDGLFGSGLNRAVSGVFADLVSVVNGLDAFVVSIDVPSGLDGTTGAVLGCCVRADLTVCLDAMKSGLLCGKGPEMAGKVSVCPIGIPAGIGEPCAWLMDEEAAADFLPVRNPFGHKGTFGRALVCGGSALMSGAVLLAADACFHAGCGLLYTCVPESIRPVVQTDLWEAIQVKKPDPAGMDAVLVGNGMGRGPETQACVASLLESDVPVVVDADGLFGLDLGLLSRSFPTILTPHLAEFARLTGKGVPEDSICAARDFSLEYPGVVLVLKSAITCIAQNGKVVVAGHPDSTLAKGGSGDVLAGLITGLLAQGMDAFEAACCGVQVHSMAAGLAQSARAFSPRDLISNLGDVFSLLNKKRP